MWQLSHWNSSDKHHPMLIQYRCLRWKVPRTCVSHPAWFTAHPVLSFSLPIHLSILFFMGSIQWWKYNDVCRLRMSYFTHHEALARGCSVMALNSRDWQSLTLVFDSPHLRRARYSIHLTDQFPALTQDWKCNGKIRFSQCTLVNIRSTMYTSMQLTQRQIKNVNSPRFYAY